MKILAALALAACVGCGQSPGNPSEDSFQPYITYFEQVAAQQGHPVAVGTFIYLVDNIIFNEREYVAYCDRYSKMVAFSRHYWYKADDDYKTSVIFHELGHCELGQEHRNGLLANGAPRSVMNEWAPTGGQYAANREYYNHELFTH